MNDQSSATLESMSQAVWYNRWTLEKFSKFLKGQILEIGCGIGNFSKLLLKYGELTAIDINDEYVNKAKKEIGESIKIGVGDIEKGKYFFQGKGFNTIVCINVLEHIKSDQKALKNIYDLLSSNGNLILLVPAHQFLYNLIDESIGHFRRYEREKLKKLLLENGFEILKIRNLNFIGSLGWFIGGKLFRDSNVGEGKIKIFNLIAPPFLLLENIFEPPFGTSILVVAKKKKI